MNVFSKMFRANKSRSGMYDVTPRKLLKTLRGDLEKAEMKKLAPIPEEIYFTVVKMFPNTTPDKRLELAEAIDGIFLQLPKDRTLK